MSLQPPAITGIWVNAVATWINARAQLLTLARNDDDVDPNFHSSSRQNMEQNGLAPVSLSVESPGSSVFDLPVYQDNSLTIPRILSPSSSSELTATGVNQTSLENQSQDQAGHSYVVISGGTGGNSICSAFGNACYVLPVSDDGGSSSEIIRVIGGPSIGITCLNFCCK